MLVQEILKTVSKRRILLLLLCMHVDRVSVLCALSSSSLLLLLLSLFALERTRSVFFVCMCVYTPLCMCVYLSVRVYVCAWLCV